MEHSFFTARTVPKERSELQAIRAGGAWVYADTWDTFARVTGQHAERLVSLIAQAPIVQFRYLAAMARKESLLSAYEPAYVRFLANLSCAKGQAEKLLCLSVGGSIYASYLSTSWSSRIREVVGECWDDLSSFGSLRFKEVAQDHFGGAKGSYYWAKAILEHLVHLKLARHQGNWSVKL